MRILLDECVPLPAHQLLQHVLRGHEVHHVATVGWAGKKDIPLLRDAGARGYQVFVTNNVRQYNDPAECDAIKRSGLHHVTYEVPRDGLDGLALAAGAMCAALRGIARKLEDVPDQRLARITSLSATKDRFQITDPTINPPSPYWR